MKAIIIILASLLATCACSTKKNVSEKLDLNTDSISTLSTRYYRSSKTVEAMLQDIEIDSMSIIPVRTDTAPISEIRLYGISSTKKSKQASTTIASFSYKDSNSTNIKERKSNNIAEDTRRGRIHFSNLVLILFLIAIIVLTLRIKK